MGLGLREQKYKTPKAENRKQKTDDTAEVLKADRRFQGFALLTYKSQRKK